MTVIPVHIPLMSVHIHADRRLAFQVITAFGASTGDGSSSKVLEREGERLLVEFHTPGRDLLGRRRTYRTVEWVTPREPDVIKFEGVEGPLTMLRDRFDLVEEGGCTRLDYRSEFGLAGWVFGWLVSMFVGASHAPQDDGGTPGGNEGGRSRRAPGAAGCSRRGRAEKTPKEATQCR